MNLYKILINHSSPKDNETGIVCLLLAENDEQVYEWLKSQDRKVDNPLFTSSVGWEDSEDETFSLYNDEFEEVGIETFKEKMIRIKGEMNDDDYDFSAAYYGITLYGWELLKENPTTDFSELIELGVVHKTEEA